MILKPQDILILLKLVALKEARLSYGALAVQLGMSPAEVHAGCKRAVQAKLAVEIKGEGTRPIPKMLLNILLNGVPYFFVAEVGGITRGIPTAWGAPFLAQHFVSSDELPPIWPHPNGKVRGYEVSPLYKAAPDAALKDDVLYELLVLVDALRIGKARDKVLAEKLLKERLITDAYSEPQH